MSMYIIIHKKTLGVSTSLQMIFSLGIRLFLSRSVTISESYGPTNYENYDQ